MASLHRDYFVILDLVWNVAFDASPTPTLTALTIEPVRGRLHRELPCSPISRRPDRVYKTLTAKATQTKMIESYPSDSSERPLVCHLHWTTFLELQYRYLPSGMSYPHYQSASPISHDAVGRGKDEGIGLGRKGHTVLLDLNFPILSLSPTYQLTPSWSDTRYQ